MTLDLSARLRTGILELGVDLERFLGHLGEARPTKRQRR